VSQQSVRHATVDKVQLLQASDLLQSVCDLGKAQLGELALVHEDANTVEGNEPVEVFLEGFDVALAEVAVLGEILLENCALIDGLHLFHQAFEFVFIFFRHEYFSEVHHFLFSVDNILQVDLVLHAIIHKNQVRDYLAFLFGDGVIFQLGVVLEY